MFPTRVGVTEDQIRRRHSINIGADQMEEAQGIVWVGQKAEKRDHQPYLLPDVQTPGAAEAPRKPFHVQRPEERIGIAVSSNKNGDVPRRARFCFDQLLDLPGHPVGLFLIGLKDHALNSRAIAVAWPETLVHPLTILQAIRIVVLDDTIRGIENAGRRAVVLYQNDRCRLGKLPAEAEDVAD